MKQPVKFLISAIFAVIFLLPQLSYSQNTPQWLNEGWRLQNYPQDNFYTGFSYETLKQGMEATQTIKRVEKDAQNKLIENINVSVSRVSTTGTTSIRNQSTETIDKNYSQIIQTTANAEIIKTAIYSYHDVKNNILYAFAAVKKADLADYYVSKIEFALNEAKQNIEQSKQLLELNKLKEAREKLNDGETHIDSTDSYRKLLITVDTQNGIARSKSELINELLKEITTVKAEIEAKDVVKVFLEGKEDIIILGLQTILSENDVVVAENKIEASHILKIDANVCNSKTDGYFYYAYACVKVTLSNVRTGINEITATVNGKKAGGLDTEEASKESFKVVVPEVWEKVRGKVLEE